MSKVPLYTPDWLNPRCASLILQRSLRKSQLVQRKLTFYAFSVANVVMWPPDCGEINLRILVYLVIYDSGYVSLSHLLLVWYPSQRGPTPESINIEREKETRRRRNHSSSSSSLLLVHRSLSLKLSDTRVYEPQIRARLGTTAHFCQTPPP